MASNINSRFRRVVAMTSPSTVMQLPMVVDVKTGKTANVPITDQSTSIPLQNAQGCVIQNSNNMAKNMNGLPFAVAPAENVYGDPGVYRAEQPAINTDIVIWQISLNNTAGAAAEFVIFDGFGLVANKLGLSAIPGTVTVGGTFGTNTAAFFQTITRSKAVRLHQLWLQSATTGGVQNEQFFNTGFIKQSYGSLANNSVVDDLIPLVNQVHQDTYQTSIREIKDYRLLVDAQTALHILLPASTQVNIALYISAIEQTYDMNKIA